MKTEMFIKFFENEECAMSYMRLKNKAVVVQVNDTRPIYAVVDGPEDNFAVVDLRTAIELGGGYKWEV